MIKRRITDALREVPIRNGEYLKGEHLKLFRDVLSAGINANKNDIDLIASGNPEILSFYTTYNRETGNMLFTAEENLKTYDGQHQLPNGSKVILYESGDFENYGVYLGTKVDGEFVLTRLGLVSDEERAMWSGASLGDVLTGRVQFYKEGGTPSGLGDIDGFTPKAGELVLLTGTGAADGVYQINAGAWTKQPDIRVNQVLSVDKGLTHGGSMYKLTEYGTYTLVKQPERSTWIVLL